MQSNHPLFNHPENRFILNCILNNGIPTGTSGESRIKILDKRKNGNPNSKIIEFYYFLNPDKTIRWIVPASNDTPLHLLLYSGSGIKAKLFNTGTRLAYATGLKKRTFHGSFFLEHNPLLENTAFPKKNEAFFAGTTGANRKMILVSQEEQIWFEKIPTSEAAINLGLNEYVMIKKVELLNLALMQIPKIRKTNRGIAVQNIKPRKEVDSRGLSAQHIKAFHELYNRSGHKCSLETNQPFGGTLNAMAHIMKDKILSQNGLDQNKAEALRQVWLSCYARLSLQKQTTHAIGHGDFTPWNTFVQKERLAVFDWELGSSSLPVLYDLFHYTLQEGVLQKKLSNVALKKSIQSLESTDLIQSILVQHSEDFTHLFSCYLLHVVGRYLPLFSSQQHLHEQANWLISAWEHLLADSQ